MSEKKQAEENEIPEMSLEERKYTSNKKLPQELNPEISDKTKKEIEKTKKELDKFKKIVLKKYPFTIALGILPPQSSEKIEEEEEVPEEECKLKPMHLIMLIPEEHFKEIGKIKINLIKELKNLKSKVWLHIKTPVDLWNYCLDSKFDIISAISMSFPLFDTGLLGSLRVAEIHKSLVLQKFEKYVTSYVIAGSLVRGEATKTSDIDVFIIINDTDVKRMPRLELKEKLRSIIYSYVAEASALAGVKNKLSPQIYILTDFWESVKDAHPVIFTFIRDGIPLYDRGTFLPWKLLLKMGKLKPSPEAIEMFMSMGDKTFDTVNRRLIDAMIDIYYGILTPSQALLMLYGLPPPAHKETPKIFKEIFVDKEKLIEKKYVETLEKAVRLFKEYEHEKLTKLSGKEIDSLVKDAEAYMKRLKELKEQIEKRALEKTINQINDDILNLLKSIFGKKSKNILISEFEKKLVAKGKVPSSYKTILKEVLDMKNKYKKGKIKKEEIEQARKKASLLMNYLIDYAQRCELVAVEKGRFSVKYGKDKNKKAEIILTKKSVFLIHDKKIEKIDKSTGKSTSSQLRELNEAIRESKNLKSVQLGSQLIDVLKKKLGEFDFVL